jgi:hypothetical protein
MVMHSTAIGPPPARMEPQKFGAYAPGTSLPPGSTLAAPYSQGFTQHAWSMGAPAHCGLFGVPDWKGSCVNLSELDGGGAGQTSFAPPRRTTLHLYRPRMTRSRRRRAPRPHRALDALMYSEGHIRRRPRTRGEEQESARTGTGGVDTPDSVDSIYLNYFFIILFYF